MLSSLPNWPSFVQEIEYIALPAITLPQCITPSASLSVSVHIAEASLFHAVLAGAVLSPFFIDYHVRKSRSGHRHFLFCVSDLPLHQCRRNWFRCMALSDPPHQCVLNSVLACCSIRPRVACLGQFTVQEADAAKNHTHSAFLFAQWMDYERNLQLNDVSFLERMRSCWLKFTSGCEYIFRFMSTKFNVLSVGRFSRQPLVIVHPIVFGMDEIGSCCFGQEPERVDVDSQRQVFSIASIVHGCEVPI